MTHTTVTVRIEDDAEICRQWIGPMGHEATMAALHELHLPIALGRIEGEGRHYELGFESLLAGGSGALVTTSTTWTDEVAAEMTAILDAGFGRHEIILPTGLREEMEALEDAVLDSIDDEEEEA